MLGNKKKRDQEKQLIQKTIMSKNSLMRLKSKTNEKEINKKSKRIKKKKKVKCPSENNKTISLRIFQCQNRHHNHLHCHRRHHRRHNYRYCYHCRYYY